jgi:fructan beta-fructosidase
MAQSEAVLDLNPIFHNPFYNWPGNIRILNHPCRKTYMNRFLVFVTLTACVCRAEDPYNEQYRPQYHFSPKVNWTNDPCGIVYANGEYHLFFQFNPFGDLWGHMSWGHAVSRNLVQWRELPVAIPEGEGPMIFTGSSVVDQKNTSGLCEPGTQCIVSIYTGHTPKSGAWAQLQTQDLAVSQDGYTWTKYKGNPVLNIDQTDFRDPKVFWHEASKQWIMVTVLPLAKKASIYGSPNLKDWKHLSDFGPEGETKGIWECPDLFELPASSDRHEVHWVLKIGLNPGHISGGSGEQYFVGQFDGKQFRNESPKSDIRWLDYGRDCYCALTWNGEASGSGRHMIGWMNNWDYAPVAPTKPWKGAMTLPRKLELHHSGGQFRLAQVPVESLRSLRAEQLTYSGKSPAELNRKLRQWAHRTQTLEIEATIRPGSAKRVVWKLLGGSGEYTLVGFDAEARQLFVDRTKSGNTGFSPKFPSRTIAPMEVRNGELSLRIFTDRSSVEVFADNGQVVMTNLVFPKPDSTDLSLAVEGGEMESLRMNAWNLRSIWKGLKP